MLTTQQLFTKVISIEAWYKPLEFTKQYAYNLKSDFLSGKLTEVKQQEILLKLGYEIDQPITWKEERNFI
jgi:hypothetical protein